MTDNAPVFDAVFSDGRVASYRLLLQALLDAGLAPVLHREYAAKSDMKSILLLRHDVDSDLDAAVNMASIEFQMGVRATYFLLPPGDYGHKSNYYGRIAFGRVWHSRKLLTAVRRLLGYGHEVGLHNDFAQLSWITGRSVESLLREELAWFRSHHIQVVGSASHGSEFAKRNAFVNYEMFSACQRRGHEAGRTVSEGEWQTKLHQLDMGDLGLSYEAYFLARDFAYSDSSKRVVLAGPKGYRADDLTLAADDDFQNLIAILKGVSGARCMALVHPNWWTFGLRAIEEGTCSTTAATATAAAAASQDTPSALTEAYTHEGKFNDAELDRSEFADAGGLPSDLAVEKKVIGATNSAPKRGSEALAAARGFLDRNPLPSNPRPGIAMLPFEYVRGFYEILLESDRVEFLDFNDLIFATDRDVRTEEGLVSLYADEYRIWRKKSLSSVDVPKLNLLIQHDSDSAPRETQYICELEAESGMKSTTAIFCREIDDDGTVRRYDIDYALLRRLQDEKGMCFAYHCNAGELGGYHEPDVAIAFNEDVEFLRSHGLDIRYFSPHGGASSPNGLNNYSFFYPSFSQHRLIWTHNRFAPSAQRYSDGGWGLRISRGDASLDLRKFLMTNLSTRDRPLTYRYFVLIHPQYYFAKDSKAAEKYFPNNPWLREFWDLYQSGRAAEYWVPFREVLQRSLSGH
ncbi:MAG: hypothetical protein ABTR92_04750 [Candidatus Accumulibacter phosphatis]|uniref:hypothetical protein n=1 Tax=Candidatus Accumulibacter sp. ACC012 TaxID=2823332 RepID=UPI0025BEDE07|nr:hypothetical protein [Candidatus Accumulibacter sp. ACC012]